MADLCFWQSGWWHSVKLPLFRALFRNLQDKSYRQPAMIATYPRAVRRVATEIKNFVVDFHSCKNNDLSVSEINSTISLQKRVLRKDFEVFQHHRH
jgi:hypothetical protein